MNELLCGAYTLIEYTTQKGISGLKVTSKANGNTLFFPAAGYNNEGLQDAGVLGWYMSRTLFKYASDYSEDMYFTPSSTSLGTAQTSYVGRYWGKSVRPVRYQDDPYDDWKVTKAATCGAAGQKTRTCKVCGKTETQSIAKLDHSYGSWTTTREASCEVNGEQTRTCTKCGHAETKSIAATGHKWDKGTVSSSSGCGAGVKTYTCTVCEKTRTEKTSGANHTFGDWQYEEYTFDYTDRGQQYTATGRNKYHVCSKCGYKEYADIPQHACNLTFDYVILSEAHKCGDRFAGYTKEYCKTCGYVYAIVNEYDYVIEHMTNDRRVVNTVEYHIPYTQTTDEYFYYHSEEYCTACGKKTEDTHMSRDVRGMVDIYDLGKDAQYYELGITNYGKRLHYYYELESNDNGFKYRIQLTTKSMPNGVTQLDDATLRDATLRAHFETVPVARNLQIGYYNGQKCIVGYTAYWKSNGKTYSEYVDCTLSLKDVVKKYCASYIQRVCEDVPGFDFDAWWDAYRCSNEHPYLKSSGVLGYMMDGIFGIEWFCLSAEGDHLVFSGQHHTG